MHRATIRPAAIAIGLFLLGACASRNNPDARFSAVDLLTLEEINNIRATNAYEAVERLKSHWLRPQGTSQMPMAAGGAQFVENEVQVYLDDQRLGGVATLRTVEIAAVRYIRHYSATEASARWGLNHGGGAIFVSTRPLDR